MTTCPMRDRRSNSLRKFRTGRIAAAAACGLNCVAVAALASAGVRVRAVVVRRPRAPVVTENAVFRAAFFTGFACGAGGSFGAAGMYL